MQFLFCCLFGLFCFVDTPGYAQALLCLWSILIKLYLPLCILSVWFFSRIVFIYALIVPYMWFSNLNIMFQIKYIINLTLLPVFKACFLKDTLWQFIIYSHTLCLSYPNHIYNYWCSTWKIHKSTALFLFTSTFYCQEKCCSTPTVGRKMDYQMEKFIFPLT